MTLEGKVHAFRLHVLRRAGELGNVSAACREAGISRTVFYRWRKRFVLYGADGLHPRQTGERRGSPPLLSMVDEQKIVATVLAWSTWGAGRLSLQLAQQSVVVSPSTVWRALRRVGLGTRLEQLLALEGHSAASAGLLTKRTRRTLSRTRHVQADEPVCLDTFYIGKLKGVGKLWQITGCDAASSYALAKVVAVCNAVKPRSS